MNNVKPDSLAISELRVVGTKRLEIRKIESDGDGGRMGSSGNRGIKFSHPSNNEIFIDLFMHVFHHHYDRVVGDISYDSDELISRFESSLNDLQTWSEEKMLNAIQWLIQENDSYIQNIPGNEIINVNKIKEARVKARGIISENDKKIGDLNLKLTETQKFQFGRPQAEKHRQLKVINDAIEKLNKEIIETKKNLEKLDKIQI